MPTHRPTRRQQSELDTKVQQQARQVHNAERIAASKARKEKMDADNKAYLQKCRARDAVDREAEATKQEAEQQGYVPAWGGWSTAPGGYRPV